VAAAEEKVDWDEFMTGFEEVVEKETRKLSMLARSLARAMAAPVLGASEASETRVGSMWGSGGWCAPSGGSRCTMCARVKGPLGTGRDIGGG
jgi:hypothetical protein